MKRSILKELPATRDMIDVFGGYNHNLRIREGEFFDMQNLTSADYPVLSPRPKRGIYTFPTTTADPKGLVSKDALCYVNGNAIYINKLHVASIPIMKHNAAFSNTNRTLISIGAYIIVMPDRYYLNTNDYSDKGFIDSTFNCGYNLTDNIGSAKVTFSLCKVDGDEYSKAPAQSTAPENPQNYDLWIDTSSTPHVLKQYAATTEQWTAVPTTYVKIKIEMTENDINAGGIPHIEDYFEIGDGITISGIKPAIIKDHEGKALTDKEKEQLNDLNSSIVIQDIGDDYIVVIGFIDKTCTQTCGENDAIIFSREMPKMDFIIESGNRLWGCRYGVANNGEVVNEIYASKLGDFKNWNCFAGISTDSYVASVGTDGQFTGAITHLGYPLFFKENYIHKVYGNFPANFQIQTTACRGVQQDCSKSLAIVNETLYYKSRSAICAYDGSLPIEVSSALGDVSYSDAVAGVLGNKYYVSMKDSDDYHLFVYDTAKGMWHREDNTQVVQFCNCRGNLYYIDYADNMIKMIRKETNEDIETDPISWKAITGIIGTDSPDKKYISSLVIRIKLEVGTTVRFSAEYDSSGEFVHLFTMSGTKLQSFSIPIRPKRCDHLRLKIEGKGMAKIYSICKTIEQGSDV